MSNKMALDALTAIVEADDAQCLGQSHIEQARAAIAALQAEPQPAIPEGWGFSSADFSLQASGVSEYGGVMLIRTGADRADWHFLIDEQREVIPLYVSGTGRTVAEAIASAAKNCTPLPATPPKD
jgi:hypothetical protein